MTLQESMGKYTEHLTRDFMLMFEREPDFLWEIIPGKTFAKVATAPRGDRFNALRSVHSFIVIAPDPSGKFKVGDILKSASWKAPAKNYSRGNIFEPTSYMHRCRWSGVS